MEYFHRPLCSTSLLCIHSQHIVLPYMYEYLLHQWSIYYAFSCPQTVDHDSGYPQSCMHIRTSMYFRTSTYICHNIIHKLLTMTVVSSHVHICFDFRIHVRTSFIHLSHTSFIHLCTMPCVFVIHILYSSEEHSCRCVHRQSKSSKYRHSCNRHIQHTACSRVHGMEISKMDSPHMIRIL